MNRKLSIIRLLTSQHKGAETENALSSRNNCMDVYYFNNKLKMKKRILTVLTVICVMASGFGTYYSYEPNPNLTSCLFADEIEALSQSGEANPSKKKSAKETWMEQDRKQTAIENAMEEAFDFLGDGARSLANGVGNVASNAVTNVSNFCEYIELNSKLQGFPCIKSQKNTGAKYTYDHNYGVSTNGNSVVVGSRLSGSTDMGSTSTEYTGKTQYLCSGKGASFLDYCDRRKQLDCDGRKIYR